MEWTNSERKNVFIRGLNKVISLLSAIFLPFINLMVSAGILKGILALLLANGSVTEGTSTFSILNGISDAFFYFIPIFLAYTAA
ncbi:PTS beta-glucoside transporter subunit IIABC, partial [Eubacterium callanderi]|nr:PTS beta-glucoside transporter subunit IIABC [Eubacterium callanderi]